MPKGPKWVGDLMESLLPKYYNSITVVKIDKPLENFMRIRFRGNLKEFSYRFAIGDDKIEFRVSDTEFRHYTIAFSDEEKGVFDILFFMHGPGPGTSWLEKLKVGDELKLMGPGGKAFFSEKAATHFVFGDETSLGITEVIMRASKIRNQNCISLLELDEENKNVSDLMGFSSNIVNKLGPSKGQHAIDFTNKWLKENINKKEQIAFYLTGNAKSISVMRKNLRSKGITNNQIWTKSYWVEGKTGL